MSCREAGREVGRGLRGRRKGREKWQLSSCQGAVLL